VHSLMSGKKAGRYTHASQPADQELRQHIRKSSAAQRVAGPAARRVWKRLCCFHDDVVRLSLALKYERQARSAATRQCEQPCAN
jgi:hypothetical protein